LQLEVNVKNLSKRIPLHFAAQSGYIQGIKLLVENKSNLSMGDESGNTLSLSLMTHRACCHTCYTITLKNTQRKYTNREQRTNKLDQYTFHQGTNQHIKKTVHKQITNRQEHQTRTDDIHMRPHTA
jgi:ankyrin repeat protein